MEEMVSDRSPENRLERLNALSDELNALRTLPEPRFTSRVPLLGPLVVAVRRLWNWMSTKWYVQPILEQQNRFNEQVVRSLDELAGVLSTQLRAQQARDAQADRSAESRPALWEDRASPKGFGFTGRAGEDCLDEMDEASLLTWENANVPILDRHSDELEALADEKLDEDITLNYPLHWRTWLESWGYLSDLALANEILGCCPGDLVLDLAAGTCWATEFLNRLGIRTVSLDLSLEMLRRGRKRLAADRRLEHRTVAAFTVGSAQHLPFAGETFNGVLCMNALHHMPSYRQALREVYRVLKEGGCAVFSEPGAMHAETPLSQTRMRELGVLEKSVSLPLIHRLAREAGFSRMQVVPLRDPASYLFEYTATPADLDVLRQMWEETVLFSPRERARFVLQKGAERPLDSRMPARVVFSHVLRARITLLRTCNPVRSGEEFTDQVLVANEGDVIWRAQGLAGQVTCGVKICTEDGRLLRDDLGRTNLPHDVAPGEEARLQVRIPALLAPGRYLLKYDMVAEYVTWFEQQGSPTARRVLTVTG